MSEENEKDELQQNDIEKNDVDQSGINQNDIEKNTKQTFLQKIKSKIFYEEGEEEEEFSFTKELFSWLQTIVIAVLLAYVINTVFILNAKVPTGSMESTVMTGDKLLAWRGAYWFDEPENGDIIVFRYPDDPTGETLYLKRVIGVGGDVITIRGGDVYINDTLVNEPYLNEPMRIEDRGPYVVPEGHIFVMGDNRNSSQDSRYWSNTYVDNDEVLGRVVFRYPNGFKWMWN